MVREGLLEICCCVWRVTISRNPVRTTRLGISADLPVVARYEVHELESGLDQASTGEYFEFF